MKLYKLAIVLTVLMIGVNTGFSQVNEEPVIKEALIAEYASGTTDEIAQIQTDRMKTALQLSDGQETNVHYLNKKVAEKIAAIKNNPSITDDKKEEFIKGNLKDRRKAMSTILTPNQFDLFDEMDY